MKVKKLVAGVVITALVGSACVGALATSQSGYLKYKEHNVFVSGYVDYMDGYSDLIAKDKVWASATMSGSDSWYVASKSDGTSAKCTTNKGTVVLSTVLTAENPKIKVTGKTVAIKNTSATLVLNVLADSNNILTLTATD